MCRYARPLRRVEHHLRLDLLAPLGALLDAVAQRPARRELRHHAHVVRDDARPIEVDDLVAPELVEHRDLLEPLDRGNLLEQLG